MNRHPVVGLAAVAWAAGLAAAAPPRALPEETVPEVVVTGTGSVPVPATGLQLSFTIQASGDGVAKAAEALEAKRKETAAKLAALGAPEKDVTAERPFVVAGGEATRAAALAGNRLRKKKGDEKEERVPVVVAMPLVARFHLAAKDPLPLLVESEQIKAKVREARLVPEDEESDAGGQPGQDPLGFQFCAARDERAVEEAAARALAAAGRLAEKAARAAGRALGGLRRVTVQEERLEGEARMMWRDSDGQRLPLYMRTSEADLLLGNVPEELKVTLSVTATYGLK